MEEVRGLVPSQRACELVDVSKSGYYAWRTRSESNRTCQDRRLRIEIRAIFRESRGTYGSPRVTAELRARGHSCSEKRVARLMREEGIKAIRRRRRRTKGVEARLEAVHANVLDRDFSPVRPNVSWASDITYLPTAEGWIYLAVVLDLFSRRVVGWSLRPSLAKELTTDALVKAVKNRRPRRGLLHHSDQGSQYTSYRYQSLLRREGFTISMSRRGSCHDNAPVESFFGTLKNELHLRGDPFETHEEARRAIFEYIEIFYNRQRRHSTLGNQAPAEYEEEYFREQTTVT